MVHQKLNNINKGVFSLLCFFFLLSSKAQISNESIKPQIYHIQNYFSEAYLVKGNSEKLILIETGVPVAGYQDSLVNAIRKMGFEPANISLAIVTHGHGDHAGNARFLQQTYHIAIAGSKADLGKFTSGKTELAKCEDVSIWGTRLRQYSDLSYPAFTPDVLVDNKIIDLTDYGVSGKIIPIKGGHTPGDLLVLIGENLFTGDAFVSTFKEQQGGLVPDGHHVREHFYHENKQLANQNLALIAKIALYNKVETIYPTHNGPVNISELTKYLKEEPLLKLLSSKETAMLTDVMKGKKELQEKTLSGNFILQSADGTMYTKNKFIEDQITHPKNKIESLSAEDFRIVTATGNTVVMTYIEILKSAGKDAQSLAVTGTWSKEKGSWKLIYKKSIINK